MRHVCPECGDAGDRGTCARDGAVRVPAGADPLLGTVIGSWRVARMLGAGGMGRVYLAVQPAIGARVAIKVLKREAAADADLVERFFNEARAVNVIRHESIVDVIDLGRLPDASPYIVMEFLEGASLGALLRRHRPFPLGTLARLVGEVLAALGAAHDKTIVHRDLKPDNVFVSPAGRVTVLDFGIAKLAGIDGAMTQTGSLLGTPAYMAPEQARSQPVDARADLYAAGVILFEGATGAPPFAAGSLYELLDLQVKAQPPTPRSKNPGIPESLETVILRALAKDPDDRFASAAAMREALLAAVADLPAAEFAELTITAATMPGPPSDPFAPTAATQSSLAHGETMPSERSAPVEKSPSGQIQLSRRSVGALAGVAVLGLGAAAFMALRGREPTATPPADAALITRVAIDAEATPQPLVVDAPVAVVDAAVAPVVVDAAVIAVVPKPKPAVVKQGWTVDELVRNRGMTVAVPKPNAFDPKKYFAEATRLATVAGGEVAAIGYVWRGVNRAGTIDITAGGSAEYQFYSLDNAKRPDASCFIFVMIGKDRSYINVGRPSSGVCEGGRRVQVPKCSIAELWTRAAAEPVEDGATIDQLELAIINRIGRRYQFSAAGKTSKFSVSILDDCP